MARYWIEFLEGEAEPYGLASGPDAEGVIDIHETFKTRAAAEAALTEANRDPSGDERHYWAQYAYACGYHD